MHFWIDKHSQGCGFSGRHQEPPSFSGYGRNQRFLVGGFHPKPMVTPVHRFQSIESVANNGLSRHSRTPPAGYHSVLRTTHCQPPIHYNSVRQISSSHHHGQIGRAAQEMPSSIVQTPPPNTIKPPNAWGLISKCLGVVLAVGIMFCRYYFHGVNFVYAMCALVGIAFMIGALAGLLTSTHLQTVAATTPEASATNGGVIIPSSSRNEHHRNSSNSNHHQSQQLEVVDERSVIGGGGGGVNNQVPSLILSPLPCPDSELPPPPYHIAIMLPSQNDTERGGSAQTAKDSPPPSYEKAVT